LLTYYANKLIETEQDLQLLFSFCQSASIACQQTLSTDPKLNADTNCYESAMEIWLNFMPNC